MVTVRRKRVTSTVYRLRQSMNGNSKDDLYGTDITILSFDGDRSSG